jgi:NAD(P)H-hydrate epimerase
MIRLTRAEVREVDRVAVEQFGIPGIVLMENAARGAADAAEALWRELYPRDPDRNAAIVCGSGNNGGDGYATARHLLLRGWKVGLIAAAPIASASEAATNRAIAERLGLQPVTPSAAGGLIDPYVHDFLIDGLFGTGLTRPVEGDLAGLIGVMNDSALPILALDLPSGLDCNTGKPLGAACVRAMATVTFVAEKAGFANPESKRFTGNVYVADIGVPAEVVAAALQQVRGRAVDMIGRPWPGSR